MSKCSACQMDGERLQHFYADCSFLYIFRNELKNILQACLKYITLSKYEPLSIFNDTILHSNETYIINQIIMLAKYQINGEEYFYRNRF